MAFIGNHLLILLQKMRWFVDFEGYNFLFCALVSFIGIGTMIAGYLYPNTGEELSNAVEEYEKK